MRKKIFIALFFLSLVVARNLKAQVVAPATPGLVVDHNENLFLPHSTFKHIVNIFLGYGYPNVDQNYLPRYEHMYHGDISQAGPLLAAIDYQFNKKISIGAVVTRGIVSTSYFNYSSPAQLAFTTKFFNWSFMLDVVRYIPVNQTVFPYVRTAIGITLWKQDYTDIDGSKAPVTPAALPGLAYQAGIGAKFIFGKAGVFIEAGYGKYVFNGGLSMKL